MDQEGQNDLKRNYYEGIPWQLLFCSILQEKSRFRVMLDRGL